MSDIRNCSPFGGGSRDSVYVDTNRILDSCRDKDCFEDVPVYFSDMAGDFLDRFGNVRTKYAGVIGANIHVDSVPFNRGFYQINITLYVKVVIEACACPGKAQELTGIAVMEKKVILYGGEGNVNIFKSNYTSDFCDTGMADFPKTNLPTAVFEVAEPIVLNTKIQEKCNCHTDCGICPDDLPDAVCNCIGGKICPCRSEKVLTVSLGFFSIVRIERPAQYLIQGTEYTVPEKECLSPSVDDPCKMFKHMAFPVNEFYPPSLGDTNPISSDGTGGGCCKH